MGFGTLVRANRWRWGLCWWLLGESVKQSLDEVYIVGYIAPHFRQTSSLHMIDYVVVDNHTLPDLALMF